MPLLTNKAQLVEMAVSGSVTQPGLRYPGYIPNAQGQAQVLPGMSGWSITSESAQRRLAGQQTTLNPVYQSPTRI